MERVIWAVILTVVATLAILASVAVLPSAARAESSNCGTRTGILGVLARDYGEARRGLGLVDGRAVIELFVSEATGSWTMVLTTAGGETCLVAAGQAWQELDDRMPPPGKDG